MKLDELEVIDLNKDVSSDKESIKETSEHVEKKQKEEDEINWKQEFKSILSTIVITVVVVFLLKSYVIINATVPTGSMENTILPGDNLLGLRVAYLLEEPERGDVIFFYFHW